jgi:hypothetical protein
MNCLEGKLREEHHSKYNYRFDIIVSYLDFVQTLNLENVTYWHP